MKLLLYCLIILATTAQGQISLKNIMFDKSLLSRDTIPKARIYAVFDVNLNTQRREVYFDKIDFALNIQVVKNKDNEYKGEIIEIKYKLSYADSAYFSLKTEFEKRYKVSISDGNFHLFLKPGKFILLDSQTKTITLIKFNLCLLPKKTLQIKAFLKKDKHFTKKIMVNCSYHNIEEL